MGQIQTARRPLLKEPQETLAVLSDHVQFTLTRYPFMTQTHTPGQQNS